MSALIQIFARPPVAGEVKTRLIPGLGKIGACSVYENMLFGTIETALKGRDPKEVQLWLSYQDDAFLSIINIKYDIEVVVQKGKNLGEKMKHALLFGLEKHRKVILVGSDCPALTDEHYVKSSAALDHAQMVFIPAEDGGYVLVAATKVLPRCFEGIEWGTDRVMAQTEQRLQKQSYRVLQPPLRDLDDFEDYQWYQKNKPF